MMNDFKVGDEVVTTKPIKVIGKNELVTIDAGKVAAVTFVDNTDADIAIYVYGLGKSVVRKNSIKLLAQQPEADSRAGLHACTFKEVTTDSGIKQRGVWIDRNGADVLYIHASDVSALQAENTRLRGELDAARTALENIADYDVKYEHGYIDEWNEAASFTIVRKIAQDALAVKVDAK